MLMKYLKLLLEQFTDKNKKAHSDAVYSYYSQLKRDEAATVKLKSKAAFMRSIEALDGKAARNVSSV